VDRWDKRRTMLATDAARAVVICLLAIAVTLLPAASSIPAVYAAVLLCSICSQFFAPALFTLTGDLVPAPDLPRASGLNQIMINLANILGPALAGPLLFASGPRVALLVNALSFAVSFVTIRLIRLPAVPHVATEAPAEHPHLWSDFSEGIAYVARTPALRAIGISLAVAMFGIGALISLNVFFVTGPLNAPPALYGLFAAAFSAGSILGVLLTTRALPHLGLERAYWLAMALVGLAILFYARATSFGPALLLFFLMGIPNAANVVTTQPLVLRVTPRALVGRVNSVIVPLWSAATVLSYAVAGALASGPLRGFHAVVLGMRLGSLDMLFTAAGLLCLAGALYARFELHGAPSISAA
jgi:MFS family permease